MKDILALEAPDTGHGPDPRGCRGMFLLIGVLYALFLVYGNAWALPAIMATAAVTVTAELFHRRRQQGKSRRHIVELVGIAAIYLLWKNLI